jgi:polyisoprenoid-binding protein YceI
VINYDPQNVGQSSVNVTIPLAGLDTRVAKFDEHLRSADFFDAAKFPTITFKSTRVEAAGDRKLRVFGDLTIKGITKPAVLDVTINKIGEQPMAKRPAAGFDATTVIKRSDFGVDKYAPNVSDEVTITITTEAVVAKADAAK